MPISPEPDMCAAIIRESTGQWGGNCQQRPVWRARWRFDYPRRHVERVLLCDAHHRERVGDARLTDATRIGGRPRG